MSLRYWPTTRNGRHGRALKGRAKALDGLQKARRTQQVAVEYGTRERSRRLPRSGFVHIVIVSEYAPAGSLAKWLDAHAGRSPSPDLAVRLIAGVLSGLGHLHDRNIVHRDLKPANVLLQGESPRITDFGLARLLMTSTQSMNVGGTPAYMAPEAWEGERSRAADLWSAGVMLYQMLSGHLPFSGKDVPALCRSIREDPPAALSVDISLRLATVLQRAFQKNPADRYSSAHAMLSDMIHAVGSHSETVTLASKRQKHWLGPLSAAGWRWLLIGIAALVIGIGVMALRREAGSSAFTLMGGVVDGGHRPIAGALVTIDGYPFQARTSPTGEFRGQLSGVQRGEMVLVRVSHERFATEARWVVLGSTYADTLNVTMRSSENP